MEQLTVINTKDNLRRIYWKDGDKVRQLKLGPGANLVDKDIVDRIQEIKHTKALFDRNILMLRGAPEGKKTYSKGMYIENLGALKAKDALEAIKDCESPAILSQWASQDGRQKIKDALTERYSELVEPPKEEKED